MSFWDKNKFFEKLLIFSWIAILFFCLFFLSFTSHAATIDSFDDYYPMNQNNGSYFTENEINFINWFFDSDTNYIFAFWSYNYNGYDYIYLFYTPKSLGGMYYGELHNDITTFSFYSIGSVSPIYRVLAYKNDSDYNVDSVNASEFSSVGYNWCVVSNFKIYTNNNPDTQKLLLKYGSDPIGTGHATPPDTFEDPVVNSGSNHTLPREVPENPTINNYTWITYNPPSIDTTNVESLLESIIYVINYLAGWLRDNLAGEFQNLISNIRGLINYIGETIQYYGGLIISNIQNGIETFYNNMVSLFEPLVNTVNYISEPVSGTVIYDNISGTSLVTNITSVNTTLTSFKTSFDNLSEPTSFTIPIHLENLPTAYFGNQTTQYIDLSIIGSTEKGIIRTFMWALVTYGLFITIVDSISNYINGGGDES